MDHLYFIQNFIKASCQTHVAYAQMYLTPSFPCAPIQPKRPRELLRLCFILSQPSPVNESPENVESISSQALCHVDMQAVYFSNCTTDVIQSVIVKQSARLEKIMIYDCQVADKVFYGMVAPSLRYFSYCRSGFISDAAIAAIVQHCPCVETLVLTLPRNIVQANTMTQASLDSLTQFKCLKVLVCKGQIRISNGEYKNWLYKHIPSLEYCDLSFDL
ncbi:unnamed protein product [Rhizopus stolonifer]